MQISEAVEPGMSPVKIETKRDIGLSLISFFPLILDCVTKYRPWERGWGIILIGASR